MNTDLANLEPYPYPDIAQLVMTIDSLRRENALLSGRVELTLRTLSRIVAKIDPGFLDDPFDPNVRRRSDLLGETVREKLKAEALAQAESENDPERLAQLRRYFKDVT